MTALKSQSLVHSKNLDEGAVVLAVLACLGLLAWSLGSLQTVSESIGGAFLASSASSASAALVPSGHLLELLRCHFTHGCTGSDPPDT